MRRYCHDQLTARLQGLSDGIEGRLIVLDVLDDIERADQVEVMLGNAVDLGQRGAEHRAAKALLGNLAGCRIDLERVNLAELGEHREIVPGAAADLEQFGARCRQGLAADQRSDDLAAGAVPPMLLIHGGHGVVDDAFHQPKTHWRLRK